MREQSNSAGLCFLTKPMESTADLRVETSGVLPDYCEEIHKILRVELEARVTKKERFLEEKALVCEIGGVATFRLIYAGEAEQGAGRLFSHEFETEFSHRFAWPFLEQDVPDQAAVFVSVKSKGASCKPLGARKPSFSGSISLAVRVFQNEKEAFVSLPAPDVEVVRDQTEITALYGAGEQDYTLEQSVTLAESSAPVQTVLGVRFSLAPSWVRAAKDQIAFGAKASVSCLYLALNEETGEESLQSFSQPIELSELMEGIASKPDAQADLRLSPGLCRCEVLPDDSGMRRILKLECAYHATAAVFEKRNADLIRDLYVCRRKAQAGFSDKTLRDLRHLEERVEEASVSFAAPPKVHDLEGLSACLTDTRLWLDQGVLRAVLSVKFTGYSVRDEDHKPVCFEENAQSELRFSIDLDQKTAQEDLSVELSGDVIDLDAKLDGDRVNARVQYGLTLAVFTAKQTRFLSALELGEEKKSEFSGISFYYPEPGETLWEIGKRFEVSQKDLLEQNGLSTSEEALPKPLLIARG